MRLAAAVALLCAIAPTSAADVDYTRDVKPLLAARCVGCHGPTKQRSGLRLDSAKAILQGGNAGPVIVPGKSADSLLIHAVAGIGDASVMPPEGKGDRLTAAQIDVLKAWIDQGEAPADETIAQAGPVTSSHWAFQPVKRPSLPAVREPSRVRNPIDRFILARLDADHIAPSPEADKVTLLRRVSLDLTGLPPTPTEVDAFLADSSPHAYEAVVDRLLASPHFGERWGRHWLDQARYADSEGYNFDRPRSMWPYRDWVIAALNRDLPFDRFVIEQLAGDLLPNATIEQSVASGFHRNSLYNLEGGVDPEQRRNEVVVDRVNTTGTTFLGLTVGCAQCHDHKYDPVSQREYFQLFAFFNSAKDEPAPIAVGSPAQLAERAAINAQVAALEAEMTAYSKPLAAKQSAWEQALTAAERAKLPEPVRTACEVPAEKRNAKQKQTVTDYFLNRDDGYRTRRDVIEEVKARGPKLPLALAMQNEPTPRATTVHFRGDFLRPGAAVQPGFPEVMNLGRQPSASLTRLDLAKWIADPAHPLTARVVVNRLWQQYFGLGLVETENDFGTQGTPPSHPELLDWLADEFVARGWSLKAIHRLIVTSATYRQSSKARPELAGKDARNRLLARQNRTRLEAEVIRDAALAASGLLVEMVGGPSVYPPQPAGLEVYSRSRKNWKADTGPNRYRRGMYTWLWRTLPHPTLTVFDATDATTACTRRNRSTTPLQALTLANDEAFVECATALAARVQREGGSTDATRLRHAFRLCVAREPSEREMSALSGLLADQRKATGEDAAWRLVGRVLLNLDEFITRE